MSIENPGIINSFIFTEFKEIERRKQPYLKLGPYAEISLEIFKKLGCQDLCRARLVCKEWKQLIEGSFLAGEAYTLALKLAIHRHDSTKKALCIEKLGDIYVEKGTFETLLQAAGLYNYAMRLSPAEEQEILKEKLAKIQNLLSKLYEEKHLSHDLLRNQFECNRQKLKDFRSKIEKQIHTLPETPSTMAVRELYVEVAQEIKAFFEILVKQSVDTLGAEPCEYAMIGFGSLAREEVTPYSDVEFGILIKEDTSINREYFKRLTTLIHLKVINLGETILPALNIPCLKAIDFFDNVTPRGFAFDGAGVEGKGCKTPFGNGKTFELIQTPEKMAQYVAKDEKGQWWHEKEPHLPMELLNFTHLLGNEELTEQYRQNVQNKLTILYQESLDLRQYLAKQHLVLADMEAFNPGMSDLGRQGMLFQVKNDFYRFPHLALDRLALLKKVTASDTFTRIDKLSELRVITEGAAEKLKDWMGIALFIRLKTYSHYQAQQEMMNPLIKPFGFDEPELIKKQFALDLEALEKIKKIYRIFIPFHQAIKEFLAGDEKKLKFSSLEDNSPETQGNIALRLFQHKKAKKFYQLARKANPKDPYILGFLGIIYNAQESLDKTAKYVKEALEISLERFNEKHPLLIALYSNLAGIYRKQGKLGQAAEYFKKALVINLELYGENHHTVAIIYSNLGMLYNEQGKLGQAAEYVKKALAINLKFFGKSHPYVATTYNNLGQIYQQQNNLGQAAEYTQKALVINIRLFSENHPQVATAYNNLGHIYHKQDNLKKAVEYAKKALAIFLKVYDENHSHVITVYNHLAAAYNNLGHIYKEQGKLEKATEHVKNALAIFLKVYGENHPTMAMCYNNLGKIYQEQGNLWQAAEYVKKALAIFLKVYGENRYTVAMCYSNLGQVYQEQRNLDKAADYINKALGIELKFCVNIFQEAWLINKQRKFF
ncbi:hypothetical protein DB42_CT00170 [Neochlamydia sp. EPS4]|uniref:tetratricopeptide repeat protein n=1 Tax=Neochlamydia sp. EPS4 TaxID=1478175 RepID=UPI0005824F55|nr:tetratricopeptide repeat protein [Neochlamydia sp. EPS4]KIC72743.1 hypothetical protein DB42_CT00170 [Neochlamydia sp. EPS4]